MKTPLLSLLLLFACTSLVFAQQLADELSSALLELHDDSGLAGFAVAIVKADTICYQQAFGYANVDRQEVFSGEQRFYIASVSKTFIGLSLMKLVEEGKLALSTPINDILPFPVTNLYHPEVAITVEHLARHTSTLLYGDLEANAWYLDEAFNLRKAAIGKTAYEDFRAWSENRPLSLGTFLEEYLSVDGKHYTKSRFSKEVPGSSFHYSNLGAALAAYIVALTTGMDYRVYVEDWVTAELGFEPGIWRTDPKATLPTSYFQDQIETPIHQPILYPAGGMMLSPHELSNYLQEMIRGYQGQSELLDHQSFQTMMNAQGPTSKSGIFWELKGSKIGHNGGNYGVTCFLSFSRETGIGKIFLTNISSYKNDRLLREMVAIWNKLAEYEEQF